MDKNELARRAIEKFQTPKGSVVDVLYGTSDGQLLFTPEDAAKIASQLTDKQVTPFYRDAEVREMAKRYKQMEKMVLATDYIKMHKVKSVIPIYAEYVPYAEQLNIESIPEELFDFIQSKVFQSKKPTTTGVRDKIFMYSKGIVDAIFLRRYPQGQVWQVGDTLVFTCSTNTELMSGTYQQIFSPLLGIPPK